MVAFRRPKSLAEYLVSAKMKEREREEGEREDVERGTTKCASKRCKVCNYLDERSYFKRTGTDKKYSINYSLNCSSSNVIYLITCKTCQLQYLGSTTTKCRTRFNSRKSRMRRHIHLDQAQWDQDDLLYRHFWSEWHSRLRDLKIQQIDRVNKEEELRDREDQWAYRLNTLSPYGPYWVPNKSTRRK